MTLLSDTDIIGLQQATPLVTPFVLANVRPASVELRLLNQVTLRHPGGYTMSSSPTHPELVEPRVWKDELKTLDEYGPLYPGQLVVALTAETVTVPNNLLAWVKVRRLWAARGLLMETLELEPGFSGRVPLPLRNIGSEPIPLALGMKVCHVFFEQLSSPATRTEA